MSSVLEFAFGSGRETMAPSGVEYDDTCCMDAIRTSPSRNDRPRNEHEPSTHLSLPGRYKIHYVVQHHPNQPSAQSMGTRQA